MSVIWQTVVIPPSVVEAAEDKRRRLRWKKIKAKARKQGHKWICGWGCGYSAPDEKSGTYIAAPGYDDYPRCNNCGGN